MSMDIGGVKSNLARRNNFTSESIISRVSTCFIISFKIKIIIGGAMPVVRRFLREGENEMHK